VPRTHLLDPPKTFFDLLCCLTRRHPRAPNLRRKRSMPRPPSSRRETRCPNLQKCTASLSLMRVQVRMDFFAFALTVGRREVDQGCLRVFTCMWLAGRLGSAAIETDTGTRVQNDCRGATIVARLHGEDARKGHAKAGRRTTRSSRAGNVCRVSAAGDQPGFYMSHNTATISVTGGERGHAERRTW